MNAYEKKMRRHRCERKVRHATSGAAWEQMMTLHSTRGYSGPMKVYLCEFCAGFHFGHIRSSGTSKETAHV